VCDVSVLSSAENFAKARRIVCGDLYFPAATYSWILRDKVIAVRTHEVCHSFVSRLVQRGQVVAVYLPELLDELARRLLFETDRRVPLTDLRVVLLAAHLGVPVVTLDGEFRESFVEHLGARSLGRARARACWSEYRGVLAAYGDVARRVASALSAVVENGGEARLDGLVFAPSGHGEIEVECLAIDLLRVLRSYVRDGILPVAAVKELCRHAVLAVLGPCGV
jgi:hypothetical protein